MPVYKYKALDEQGMTKTGTIEGDTPKEARDKLRISRYHVTDLEELPASDMAQSSLGLSFLRPNLFGEVTTFTRQFATLLRAGIPLADALKALIEQTQNPHMEAILRDVREKISQGASLAEALADHPHAFSELYVNMVKAGEAAGSLPEILNRVGEFYKKQNRIKGKVSAALAYPLIMVIIGTGVVIFLMTVVVPKIVAVVTKRGGPLPMPTEVLMKISLILQNFWWLILLIGMVLMISLKMVLNTDKGKLYMDIFLLKIPIFGDLFKKQAISRFSLTFSTLLRSGIPALDALRIVRNIVRNKVLEKALEDVHNSIVEGTDIATPLKKSPVFPPVIGYMIAVGEQSGHLEEILERISDSYDEEIDITTQKVTAMMEPVIIVCLAVVVGFIVLAVVLPMVQGFQMR